MKLTEWCIASFEKLTDTQLVKEFLAFAEPECSLPSSQKHAVSTVRQLNPIATVSPYFSKTF